MFFGTGLDSGFQYSCSYSETKCYKSHARGEMSFQLLQGRRGGGLGGKGEKRAGKPLFQRVFSVFSIR